MYYLAYIPKSNKEFYPFERNFLIPQRDTSF